MAQELALFNAVLRLSARNPQGHLLLPRYRSGENVPEEAYQEPGLVPSDEALTTLLYLALCNMSQKLTMTIPDGKAALTLCTTHFGNRISIS